MMEVDPKSSTADAEGGLVNRSATAHLPTGHEKGLTDSDDAPD